MRLTIGGLSVVAAVLWGLAGCGQKGALYLPPKSGTVVTRPAPPAAQSPGQGQGKSDQDKDKDKDQSSQQPAPPQNQDP